MSATSSISRDRDGQNFDLVVPRGAGFGIPERPDAGDRSVIVFSIRNRSATCYACRFAHVVLRREG